MTITLLDLYNTAATQEWSMYDNDAANGEEFEQSLVLALNKAIAEILYSYPFNFRERTHIILTIPGINSYDVPAGLIKQNSDKEYCIRLNAKYLKFKEESSEETGVPDSFYFKGDKLILNPIPAEKNIVTIDYITLAVGENAQGEEIFSLKNEDDVLTVPAHLEELLKNAVISRTMLNSIASESDENYSAYKKQSETAYRMLVKYSKGVGQEKSVKF